VNKVCIRSAMIATMVLCAQASAAPAGGTFSYQGRLTDAGVPITGTADVRFNLWDADAGGTLVGGPIEKLGQTVTDGLFNTELNFGTYAFADGAERWLEIEVRSPAGVGSYVNLGRQAIHGAPYATQVRGMWVDDVGGVTMGLSKPRVSLSIKSAGAQAVRLGASSSDEAGYLTLFEAGSARATVELDADEDNTGGGPAQGSIRLRSFDGENGGLLSIANDDGQETMSLLGGLAGHGGSLAVFNESGQTVAELASQSGAGLFVLRDPNFFGYEIFEAGPDSSGGGDLYVARNEFGVIGFQVDGNYSGSDSTRVSISGATSSMSFRTDQSGNDSVVLPTGAINSAEIENEPGVASALEGTTSVSLTGGGVADTILSRTITCPASGYCVVIGSFQAGVSHSSGTQSYAEFGVSDVAGTFPGNQDVASILPSGAASGSYIMPASVHGTFQVTAGSHTFYLVGEEYSGSWGAVDSQLTIMYFPTNYGTVTPTLMGFGGDESFAPTAAPMSPVDIEREYRQSVADDMARRDAEAGETARRLIELEARIRELEAQQDNTERELPVKE